MSDDTKAGPQKQEQRLDVRAKALLTKVLAVFPPSLLIAKSGIGDEVVGSTLNEVVAKAEQAIASELAQVLLDERENVLVEIDEAAAADNPGEETEFTVDPEARTEGVSIRLSRRLLGEIRATAMLTGKSWERVVRERLETARFGATREDMQEDFDAAVRMIERWRGRLLETRFRVSYLEGALIGNTGIALTASAVESLLAHGPGQRELETNPPRCGACRRFRMGRRPTVAPYDPAMCWRDALAVPQGYVATDLRDFHQAMLGDCRRVARGIWHKAIAPGVVLCGANEPNMAATHVEENVTCPACLSGATGEVR